MLILTTFDLDEYVYEAMRAGASGFLLKDVPRAQLIAGVRTVAAGDALLAPVITRRLIERFVKRPPASIRPLPPQVDELTARELEVLRLVARGRSNSEIAGQLVISEATVKTHISHALQKLGLRDRVQAVVFAIRVRPGRTRFAVAAPAQRPSAGTHPRGGVGSYDRPPHTVRKSTQCRPRSIPAAEDASRPPA